MEEQDMNNDIEQPQQPESAIKDTSGVMMEGHIRIFDPETGEDYVNKRNAIHYENMSEALALSVANKTTGFVHEMAFGNGGTSVDPTGVISTAPAYLMNSAADGEAVALVGRVPVRVVGSVNKGEAVFATHNGKASTNGQGKIVGIALETNSDLGEKSVECMLKV